MIRGRQTTSARTHPPVAVFAALILIGSTCAWAQPERTPAPPADATVLIDPVAVVAAALDVDPVRVAIQHSQATNQATCRRVVAVVDDGGAGTRQAVVEYEATNGLLRRLSWPDARVDTNGEPIPIEATLERARVLMDRLFPAVPVEMALLHAGPLGSFVARDGVGSPLTYHFVWQGAGPGGATTGDLVAASVSAATGEPIAYQQRVAPKRPQLDDIVVSREQAVRTAIGATTRMWRDARDLAVKADAEEARLVLSSPVSPHDGPVWLVDIAVTREAPGEQLERTQRAVDAMSGEILR